jgi:ADP-ribose pyrophosphatase
MTLDPRQVRELGRRILHRGSIGSFGLYEVELPSGHSFTLEVIRHPGAAAVVPFLDRERIVLIRQYRFAPGRVLWEVPAGKLEPGEPPADCAARELAEETGYRAGHIERMGEILTTPGFTDECIHLFRAWDLSPGSAQREANEWMEVRDVQLADALAMVESGEIVDAKTIVALHHAARRANRRS